MTAVPAGVAMPSLVRWGISADADLVYRTLATFGSRESGAVARELGLSPVRTRQALDELTAIGAAIPQPGPAAASMVWTAARPERVVTMIRQRRMRTQAQLDPVAQYIQVLRDAGIPLDSAVRPSTRITLLPGRAAARRRIADLVDGCQHEHLSIHPEASFTAEETASAAPTDQSLARNVAVSTVCLPSSDGDMYAASVRASGVASRYADQLPLKLQVFDRQRALVRVDPQDNTKGMLEVADPDSVEALLAVFRREWAAGRNPQQNAVRPIVLTIREEELVKLLVCGLTDDVAAKRLQVSPRTVTTLVRGLMDRLGVENRFQLGLALGARAAQLPGLLPPARPLPADLPAQHRKAS
jgi:DNA-binding CsgD family transcriptional regulator